MPQPTKSSLTSPHWSSWGVVLLLPLYPSSYAVNPLILLGWALHPNLSVWKCRDNWPALQRVPLQGKACMKNKSPLLPVIYQCSIFKLRGDLTDIRGLSLQRKMYNHQTTEASFYQNVIMHCVWILLTSLYNNISVFILEYISKNTKVKCSLFYSGLCGTCKLADGCDVLMAILVWHSIRDCEQQSFISFVFAEPTHTRAFTHLHLLTLSKSIIYIDSLFCKPFELVALQACCLKPKSPLWFSLD